MPRRIIQVSRPWGQQLLRIIGSSLSLSETRIHVLSGGNVIYATSPALSDVQTALSLATNGDTIIIPAGDVTWMDELIVTKSVSFICAGVGNTIIRRGFSGAYNVSYLIYYQPDAAARASNKLFRWSGTTFNFAGYTGSCFGFYDTSHGEAALTKNRIDHCNFTQFGDNRVLELINGHFYGVMDNCTMDLTYRSLAFYGSNATSWTSYIATPGGADNFFIEDCTITLIGGTAGASTSGAGGRYCIRHCIIDKTQSTSTQCHDIHGSMYNGGNLSTMICEIYDNEYDWGVHGGYFLDHRGGYGFYYNNNHTSTYGPSDFAPIIREELIDSFCPPARNAIDNTPQYPHDSYQWSNYWIQTGGGSTLMQWRRTATIDYNIGQADEWLGTTHVDQNSPAGQKILYIADTSLKTAGKMIVIDYRGTREEIGTIVSVNPGVSVTLMNNLTYSHLALDADNVYIWGPPAEPYRVVPSEDLDYWNHKASFNGTSGIGVGLLSQRPGSCTLEGAGWWATDENKLYRWHSAAWELYYQPYTYPHPLRGE